jgi:hypothetical protein
MIKYKKPKLKEKLSEASVQLVSDLLLSIVGQIRVFEGKNTRPGALYGISRSLRMLHEHFEAGYTEEAKKDIIHLGYDTNPRTIREVYSLSRKIEKSKRNLYVEHTDGGIKELAIELLGLYKKLKGNDEDILTVSKFINENTYFIIKHKEQNKDINEKFSMKYFLNNSK